MAANVAEAMDGANLFQSKYFSSGHDQTKTETNTKFMFFVVFFLSDAWRPCHGQRCCPRIPFASVFICGLQPRYGLHHKLLLW